jgi:hypothetical protein
MLIRAHSRNAMCFNRELIARNEKLGTSILCGIGGRYIVQHYAAFDPIRQEYRATQKGCTSEIYTAISEGVCASQPARANFGPPPQGAISRLRDSRPSRQRAFMPTVARRPICPDPFQMFRHIVLTAAALTAIITAPTIALEAQSDAEIVQAIIRECRAIYHQGGRPCACPDDHARNGSLCGKRSAYSRPGGANPLCYPNDVSAREIADYRAGRKTFNAGCEALP